MAETEVARVKYVGPFAEGVYLPSLDREVKPGEALDVPLEVAAALALQADWQPVGKSAAPIEAAQADIPQGVPDAPAPPTTEGGQ